jgi:thiol-disulfide isomerase/thioredoxin
MRLWDTLAACAVLTVTCAAVPSDEVTTWHRPSGAPAKGRLTAVFGSLALITDGTSVFFVSLGDLDERETRRVADFLAAKPSVRPTWGTSTSAVTKSLRSKLEILRGGRLRAYDPAALPEPEVYLVYFSARWCPPCERYTPELIKDYLRLQQVVPQRFELIFVSDDRNAGEQHQYARETNMPWPVLKYSELGQAAPIERWAGDGIPCLVALTPEGNVIFHTYDGNEYLGPEQVVSSFEALVPMLAGTSPDIRRLRHRLSSIQHLDAVGKGSSPPEPYLLALNPRHYQTLEVDQLKVSVDIDASGKVTDVRSEPQLSIVLQDRLSHDASDWLFLPAIKDGKAVAQTVTMPVQIGRHRDGVDSPVAAKPSG